MFHTERHPATLAKLSTFTKDDESGIVLSFSLMMPALTLERFSPGLLGALYRAADVISTQATPADLVPRFSEMKSVPWSATIVGARIQIERDDLFGQEGVQLVDCEVDGFVFKPQVDGALEIALRVKARPDEADVGRAYSWIDKIVLLTITPPEHATYEPAAAADDDQADMLDDDGDDIEGDDPDTIPVAAPAKKPKQKRPGGNRRKRAYPTALDGTGDTDPFAAPAGGPLQ